MFLIRQSDTFHPCLWRQNQKSSVKTCLANPTLFSKSNQAANTMCSHQETETDSRAATEMQTISPPWCNSVSVAMTEIICKSKTHFFFCVRSRKVWSPITQHLWNRIVNVVWCHGLLFRCGLTMCLTLWFGLWDDVLYFPHSTSMSKVPLWRPVLFKSWKLLSFWDNEPVQAINISNIFNIIAEMHQAQSYSTSVRSFYSESCAATFTLH